ncbi:MAG: hypothetical protein AABZ61_09715, partial [Bacteroidota bacterium]
MTDEKPKSSPYIGKGALMAWIWSDREIEDHTLLEKEFFDLKAHGFLGTLASLRASHYEIFDPMVTDAVVKASRLSHTHGMKFWWLADPRLASRKLINVTGDSVDNLFTTPVRSKYFDGPNPSIGVVQNGKYLVHVEYLLRRRSHMFTDVSLHYEPVGLERVFLFKLENVGILRKESFGHGFARRILHRSIRDVTKDARFYVNFNEDYVEIFGFLDRRYAGWYVMAFPRFRTNIQDYASPANEKVFAKLLHEYHARGVSFDGLAWDEPGYCAEFGRFPVSKHIYKRFREKNGYDLADKLYGILLDVDDNSHIRIRIDYYSVLMDAVFGWEKRFWNLGRKMWGDIEMGIHHTWHGESTGTEDMVHGSFDLWKGLGSVSGGWSDEGVAERLMHPDEFEYAKYITNMVLAKSLARFSKTKTAYYNLWGVDYDGTNPKYPPDVMEYWVDLMEVFSIKWLAHAYGWTGVMNFNLGFGPGYPDHPTWDRFTELNQKIDRIERFTGLRIPEANIALVYPIESLMAIGNLSGNAIAGQIFDLVYELTAAGYAVDMISPGLLGTGSIQNSKLRIQNYTYEYLILPYSPVLPRTALKLLHCLLERKFPVFFDKNSPRFDSNGKRINLHVSCDFSLDEKPAQTMIEKGLRKLCDGPGDAYLSMMRDNDEYIFALCPLRFRGSYSGEIRLKDFSIPIPESRSIRLVRA